MRHTQKWVKTLAVRALQAQHARNCFAIPVHMLIGPLLATLSAGVAVARMNGNLICLQGAVQVREGEERMGERQPEEM